MPEITLTGVNGIAYPQLSTWGWQIAGYLFLGGLVAGLMVISGVLRLTRAPGFEHALVAGDLAGLPLLGVGMLLLLIDLENKLNVWRLYTTFQVTSAMSWGAWILLATMIVLALRWVALVPAPSTRRLGGWTFFASPPMTEEEVEESLVKKPSLIVHSVELLWIRLFAFGEWLLIRARLFAIIGVVLGAAVGLYTGVLLSTIPARPLWNTAVLAPLFLVSGLASGGAFLSFFFARGERERLAPGWLVLGGIEIVLLLALVVNLVFGNQASQRAGSLLMSGNFGLAFWALVLFLGLVMPMFLEQLEVMHRRIPLIPASVPPLLKLTGGLALRFVIVFAGLLSTV